MSACQASPLDSLTAAQDHVESVAWTPSAVGTVGLELEFHLVDLRCPARRPTWEQVSSLLDGLPPMPGGSSVTVEPGGQLELSTSPKTGVVAAVTALRNDRGVLRRSVAGSGFGLASVGSDPARPVHRINPSGRYAAMEGHFDAIGCGGPARAMMSATAALQVNLNAGRPELLADRLARIHRLGPVLVALSACSPLLAGGASGWCSMRQQVWGQMDPGRCGPVRWTGDYAQDWAWYALDAPLMLVRDPDSGAPQAVTGRVPFSAWVSGHAALSRPPTRADLDYHLTTLFPPIRPRGYLEIRCMDAVPDRWWPALAALVVTLIDEETAADQAAEICAPVQGRWAVAARDGLRHHGLNNAARACMELAARRCPIEFRRDVEAYAELVARGRSPGDDLRERAAVDGPLAVLREEADA